MDIDVSELSPTSKYKVYRLFVTVYSLGSLQKPPFQGFVKSISSVDPKGPFDILPTHENFITQFSKKLEILPETGDKVSFEQASGVIEVANNIVKIFLRKNENRWRN